MAVLALAAALVLAGPAQAADDFDGCTGIVGSLPAVISTPGTWCLTADATTAIAEGAAISIASGDVLLDCNGFRISGHAAGPATRARGVFASGRSHVTVRGCRIGGFHTGIELAPGGRATVGHRIERNRLDGNQVAGIVASGDGTRVSDNHVFDTGGSPLDGVSQSRAILVTAGRAILVEGNHVHGVAYPAAGYWAVGIAVRQAEAVSLRDNQVSGLWGGWMIGIDLAAAKAASLRGNALYGPYQPGSAASDPTGSIGIRCTASSAFLAGNTVLHFGQPDSLCLPAPIAPKKEGDR